MASEFPWDAMTSHDEVDDFLDDEIGDQPEGWDRMTLAEKKTWLDENYPKPEET